MRCSPKPRYFYPTGSAYPAFLMLLGMPNTQVVFVANVPADPVIVD
jgi:hypothetical protein